MEVMSDVVVLIESTRLTIWTFAYMHTIKHEHLDRPKLPSIQDSIAGDKADSVHVKKCMVFLEQLDVRNYIKRAYLTN